MKQTIQIRCAGSRNVDVDSLEEMQGGLKTLTKDNYERLKKEIVETGFAFPILVWNDGGRNRIVGGHQRFRTLKTMRRMGYDIPEIPVIDIEADSEREAKRRVLQDASQYGIVDQDGFLEFLSDSKFELDFAEGSFRLPDIKWESFFESNAPEIDPNAKKERSSSDGVKQVVLKFDEETHRNFEQFCSSLSHKFDTRSVSDTVYRALEQQFKS